MFVFVLTKQRKLQIHVMSSLSGWRGEKSSVKAVLSTAGCHLYNQLSQVCSMVGVLAEEAWPVNTDVRTLNNQPGLMMKHVITAGATFHNRKKPKLFENQTKGSETI